MVDAIVSQLVSSLGKPLIKEIGLLRGVRDQMDSLSAELRAIESFLKDMSFRQRQDEKTKNWVLEVRNVACEAEDIVETFMLEVDMHGPLRRPVRNHSIARDIERVLVKIKEISDRRFRYSATVDDRGGEGSNHGSSHGSSDGASSSWRRSSPHLGDDVIIGLDHYVDSLLQRVFAPGGRREVIAITGMGGIGKTTLATMVYNRSSKTVLPVQISGSLSKDENFYNMWRKYFDACAWVSVNQEPDVGNLLWDIMDQIGFPITSQLRSELCFSHGKDTWIRRRHAEMIHQFLLQKRFLIALDDVWRSEVWDQIKAALPISSYESRVIVTTRSMEVANYVDTSSNPHEMQPLNDEDSWELFLSKIFRASNLEGRPVCPRELEDLGRCLSKRCGGLPLALAILGSLLSGKEKNPVIWSNLNNNLSWESSDVRRQCLEILSLSYHDLPYYLKPCFLYLGSFRQGSEICVSKMVEWWIADDLIDEFIVQETGRTMKEIATDYLEELIQRSLVQVLRRGSDEAPKRIRIHDLIGNLSRLEAREGRFFQTIDPTYIIAEKKPWEITHRRLALHVDSLHLSILDFTERLRALLVLPRNKNYQIVGGRVRDHRPIQRILKMVPLLGKLLTINSLPNSSMRYLRVLELEGLRGVLLLPENSMIHLRYLGLRDSELTRLPISPRNAQHLQTLDIRGTSVELPKEFWTLNNLQHLYLNRVSPPRLHGLTNLQTLHQVVPGSWVEDLPKLIYLRNLRIDEVSESCHSSLSRRIREIPRLSSLKLYGESIAYEVIPTTLTHFFLYNLKLDGRIQPPQLPSYDEFLWYLTKLTLVGSRLEIDPMPTLEQLRSLRTLKLKDDAYYGPTMVCSPGGFQNLQYLKLSKLSIVTSCILHLGSLRSLTRLSIHCCPLEMLPRGLQYIVTLKVLKLKDPNHALLHRIQDGEGEDWYKIRHVPSVVLCNSRRR